MATAVKTVAIFRARPNKEQDLKELLCHLQRGARAEPGNIRFDLWIEPTEPGRFVLDELYTDANAVLDHRQTSHYKRYTDVINNLADRIAVTAIPFDIV